MPGHKFGCVQTAHMYVYKYMLNPACHKLGCIQLHMYMCQAQSFCQRRGHSWSPVWHLTCHRTSEPDIFLRSTTCRPLTSIALAKWKIDTHNCDWNIFIVPSPVLGILACDYRQTATARRANGLGADLTPLMHGGCCLWPGRYHWILVPTLRWILPGIWNLVIEESEI